MDDVSTRRMITTTSPLFLCVSVFSIFVSVSSSMATLQSLTCSSPICHRSKEQHSSPGLFSRSLCLRVWSSLNGQRLKLPHLRCSSSRLHSKTVGPITMMVKPTIQFIQGTDELSIPDVRLTKSRDGTNGMAIFRFEQPSVFDSSTELGDITGFYMIDEEGVLQSVDVSAKFINGKPAAIEAKYVMRNPREWDRFMRFMERYSNANGLQFVRK